MTAPALSILLLVVVMVIWGGTYVVTRTGLETVPPMLFALLRFCVASLLLLPLALLRRRASPPQPLPWKTLALMALTGVAAYYIAFNLSLAFTTASQGAMIQSSIPAVTAVMAVFWLRERVSSRRTLGIVLAVIGVAVIVARAVPDPSARDPLLGNVFMFGSVVMWGAYTVLAKRVAALDPLTVTTSVAVLGTIMLVPAALVERIGAAAVTPKITAEGWMGILYLGGLASAGGYLLYSRALRDLDASQVGAFVNLAPVIGVATGIVLLGERITPVALAGGVLVLAGVWLSSR